MASQPLPALQQPLFVGLPGAAPLPVNAYPVVGPAVAPGFTPVPAPFAGAFTPYGTQGFALQGAFAPASPFAPGFAPLGAIAQFPPQSAPLAQPALQGAIQDLGREIVATFEVPGVAAEDIEVVVGTQSLALRSRRPAANGRRFEGTFALPAEVLPSQAAARLEHGLLVLTLPRRTPTEEPRQLQVEG